MKKILVLVLALLFASQAHAAMVATRVSGGTVTFHTVANIITFDSVTNHITMWNNSINYDCWVDLRCVDGNDKSGYTTRLLATVKLPAGGGATPNVVELDFATDNLGFVGESATTSYNDTITYIVTGTAGNL